MLKKEHNMFTMRDKRIKLAAVSEKHVLCVIYGTLGPSRYSHRSPFHASLFAIWFAHCPYDGALMPKPLVLEIFTDHI